jgi:ribose 5-phosphate isomerase B
MVQTANNENLIDRLPPVGIASDHAGYGLKTRIAEKLRENGYETRDFGAFSESSSDYPDFAHALGTAMDKGELSVAFAVCHTGNGISIALNRHRSVRAALCFAPEIAALAREHNDANVCSIPAGFVTGEQALEIANIFLSTPFGNAARHRRRIGKINPE